MGSWYSKRPAWAHDLNPKIGKKKMCTRSRDIGQTVQKYTIYMFGLTTWFLAHFAKYLATLLRCPSFAPRFNGKCPIFCTLFHLTCPLYSSDLSIFHWGTCIPLLNLMIVIQAYLELRFGPSGSWPVLHNIYQTIDRTKIFSAKLKVSTQHLHHTKYCQAQLSQSPSCAEF